MAASSQPFAVGGVQALHPATHQKVTYTGTAGTIANAVRGRILRVVCTSAAHIAIGSAPTATANDMYVAADQPEYFRCQVGDKVSAIQSVTGGTLHVTEMD